MSDDNENITPENENLEENQVENQVESTDTASENTADEAVSMAEQNPEKPDENSSEITDDNKEQEDSMESMNTGEENVSSSSQQNAGSQDGVNAHGTDKTNMDTLLKVPVSLSIEVGRTKMPLGDLLDTQEGTVIELERLLDEPLDVLVNGALIAHGVIVLANERFGLQITDIISRADRAKSL